MEIDKINEELHNCKSSQGKINIQLANRKKLIDFFKQRKLIHLNFLKKNLSIASFGFLGSLCFCLSAAYPFAIIIFCLSSFPLGVCFQKMYVCKKFDKTIKKIETNNSKYQEKLKSLLEEEFKLINKLKESENKTSLIKKTIEITTEVINNKEVNV